MDTHASDQQSKNMFYKLLCVCVLGLSQSCHGNLTIFSLGMVVVLENKQTNKPKQNKQTKKQKNNQAWLDFTKDEAILSIQAK